jgi:hypothetical protein
MCQAVALRVVAIPAPFSQIALDQADSGRHVVGGFDDVDQIAARLAFAVTLGELPCIVLG